MRYMCQSLVTARALSIDRVESCRDEEAGIVQRECDRSWRSKLGEDIANYDILASILARRHASRLTFLLLMVRTRGK